MTTMTDVRSPLHESVVRDQARRYWKAPPAERALITQDQLLWISAREWQQALDLAEPV